MQSWDIRWDDDRLMFGPTNIALIWQGSDDLGEFWLCEYRLDPHEEPSGKFRTRAEAVALVEARFKIEVDVAGILCAATSTQIDAVWIKDHPATYDSRARKLADAFLGMLKPDQGLLKSCLNVMCAARGGQSWDSAFIKDFDHCINGLRSALGMTTDGSSKKEDRKPQTASFEDLQCPFGGMCQHNAPRCANCPYKPQVPAVDQPSSS